MQPLTAETWPHIDIAFENFKCEPGDTSAALPLYYIARNPTDADPLKDKKGLFNAIRMLKLINAALGLTHVPGLAFESLVLHVYNGGVLLGAGDASPVRCFASLVRHSLQAIAAAAGRAGGSAARWDWHFSVAFAAAAIEPGSELSGSDWGSAAEDLLGVMSRW